MGLSYALGAHWELFGLAFLAALLAGLVCPLVGCFLLVRRTAFYGLALPQFAAAGIACGFALLPWWSAHIGLGGLSLEEALADDHAALNYHSAWAAAFTFAGLGALLATRSLPGTEAGRVAASFAIANALTIVFAQLSPTGDIFVSELLRGEITVVGLHEFETLLAAYVLVATCLLAFRRDFVLLSYDRDCARVLHRPVARFELLLALLTGLTVALGVMSVGPVLLFGLLVLPPLAARQLSRSMSELLLWSSGFGAIAAIVGLELSFDLDLPMGATLVGAAAALLPVAWLAGRLRR